MMGNWCLVIQGIGPFNSDNDNQAHDDADAHALAMVTELQRRGHKIDDATFIAGGIDDDGAERIDLLDDSDETPADESATDESAAAESSGEESTGAIGEGMLGQSDFI